MSEPPMLHRFRLTCKECGAQSEIERRSYPTHWRPCTPCGMYRMHRTSRLTGRTRHEQ